MGSYAGVRSRVFGVPALAMALGLLAVLALTPSAALAGETRNPESFSPLAPPAGVTISAPAGLAIDEATGNVFVAHSNTRVAIFGPEGGNPHGLAASFELTGFSSVGITAARVAFDNSESSKKGTLYVVAANGVIREFRRNSGTERFEADGQISYPGAATTAGATVDADGNLYVSNAGTSSVYKFDPSGSLVETISGLTSPTAIAIDGAGSLFYKQQGTSAAVFKCPADAFGKILSGSCTQLAGLTARGLAVNRTTDTFYPSLNERLAQYDATTLAREFVFGLDVVAGANGVTTNPTTDRVYVSDVGTGKNNVAVFGPPVPIPDVTTQAASDVKGTTATLNGIVNPQEVEVTECRFEYGLTTSYGSSAPCQGAIPNDESDHAVSAAISGLQPNGTTYHFRIVVNSANGEVKGGNRTLVTGDTVSTEPATDVDATTATLNGIVRPEGQPLTECQFEYGTALDYGQSAPCSPSAGSIPDDFDSHAVTGALTGLEPNTTYQFRLRTTSVFGTAIGQNRSFTTVGTPQILEQRPIDVTRTSATLQARINPSGSATNVHFQFGTDTSFGTRFPAETDLNLAAGTEPVPVRAFPKGLQEKSVYWFRVVATNAKGTTVGPDQRLETLNEHDLPDNRAYELVTPADKGAAGAIADSFSGVQFTQASRDGESFMYPLLNGLDDSTAGGWLRYLADRNDNGWLSSQLSPPALIPPPHAREFGVAQPSKLRFLSPDNSCAIFESYNPLTEDTSQASVEFGVENLYSWSATDESYELISNRLPLNLGLQPGGGERFYSQIDASEDCSRVYFRSLYELIKGASGLYEWDEGTLRDAGVLPDGSVGTGLGSGRNAILGGQTEPTGTSRWNAVSPDGSRLFFTAIANEAQTVTFSGFDDGDTFTLGNLRPLTPAPGCKATSTAAIQYTSDGQAFRTAIDAALEAACSDSAANDFVVTGDPPIAKIAFQGRFAGVNVPLLSCATGGSGSCSAVETTSVGKPAIFMREDGGATVTEISASETGIATNGARFETATADGNRVIFRANYGIDAQASSAGSTGEACGPRSGETQVSNLTIEKKPCDLYVYDVETEEITDVSAHAAAPGAQIQGAVAVSDDGSHVYFAALGQLIPGKGRTYAENTAGFGSANVYLWREGKPLAYVTTLAEHQGVGDLFGFGTANISPLMRVALSWNARTSASGKELIFASSRNLADYETGGNRKFAAYLYSADTGKLTCVSCRPDGLPLSAVDVPGTIEEGAHHQSSWLLAGPKGGDGYRTRSLSEDGSRAVFTSPDALAPGAVEGKRNVYQWHEGQVSHLAVADRGGHNGARGYQDMSVDGKNIFLASGRQLAPHDKDFGSDIYAVRVDGGIPYSEPPPECQVNDTVALEPNQVYCQAVSSPQPAHADPSTSGFVGNGNVKEKAANACTRRARRAQALSKRAKALRTRARRAPNPPAARRIANRARRAAKAARSNSKAAKRCRVRARSANSNRGGNR